MTNWRDQVSNPAPSGRFPPAFRESHSPADDELRLHDNAGIAEELDRAFVVRDFRFFVETIELQLRAAVCASDT